MAKLYLGIISVVAELNKQINDLERRIATMRREFEEIKKLRKAST